MDESVATNTRVSFHTIDWAAIIGGAVIAAGVSFTLLAFGSAIGLSVVSTEPTWRDSSSLLWLISGLYLVFVALCSFGLGGYATGRMRAPTRIPPSIETEFRDGMHGLITWGLATLISAVIALGGAALASRALAPASGSAGPSTSIAGESTLVDELDELFRSNRAVTTNADIDYARAEAARMLLKSGSRGGVSAADRNNLAALVVTYTGLDLEAAGNRVTRVINDAAYALHRARVAAVIEAFMTAAALLLGAAIAWFAAAEGGKDRETGRFPGRSLARR